MPQVGIGGRPPRRSQESGILIPLGQLFEYMFHATRDHTLPAVNLIYSPLFVELKEEPTVQGTTEFRWRSHSFLANLAHRI